MALEVAFFPKRPLGSGHQSSWSRKEVSLQNGCSFKAFGLTWLEPPFSPFDKMLLGILSMIGSSLGMLLKEKNTALGWLLEKIHVTWAQLEKKRTRLQLYTNYLEKKHTVRGDGVANYKRRRQSYQVKVS
ncbi:hypothetical protein Tco_1275294 [Tanacetum coccineum]